MFWNKDNSDSNNDLVAENLKLLQKIKGLEQTIDNLKKSTSNSEFVIDFDTMRVFSIERIMRAYDIHTTIGYYMNEPIVSSDGEMVVDRDVVKEWSLYCSEEQHSKLVEEFKNWKTSNTKLV